MQIKLYTNFPAGTYADITSVCDDGFPNAEVVDDTLDCGTIVYKNTSKTPIKPLTRLDIVRDVSTTDKLFIDGDVVIEVDKHSTYNHTLVLVELTKILEKIIVQQLSLTNATDTIYQQLVKACHNIEFSVDNWTSYVFILSDNLSTLLDLAGRDFVWTDGVTAREIFDEIFATANCRVEVTNYAYNTTNRNYEITLGAIDYNAGGEEVTFDTANDTFINEQYENSTDEFCGGIYCNVKNGKTKNIVEQIDTVKSANYTTDSNNKQIILAFPIDILHKFEFLTDSSTVSITYYDSVSGELAGGTLSLNYDLWIDATDYFVDKDLWETLDATPTLNEPAQNNTIYYERGKTEVDVSATYKTVFFSRAIMENLIKKAAVTFIENNYVEILTSLGYTNIGAYVFTDIALEINADFNDALYRTRYYPQIDTAFEITKPESDVFESRLKIIDNQSSNMPDTNNLGKNLFGKLLRTGNNKLYVDVDHTAYAYLKPLLGRYGDYVIYKREFATYDNVINARYYLSQNYNNLQKTVGINRERRIYKIPLSGTECILTTRAKIYFKQGTTRESNTATLTTDALAAFVNSLISVNVSNSKIVYSDVKTYKISEYWPHDYLDIIECLLPTANIAEADTMSFISKFYDNYSAGLSIDQTRTIFDWIGGKKVAFNPYVDSSGEFERVRTHLLSYVDFGTPPVANIQTLPKIGTSVITAASDYYFIDYTKDRAQAITIKNQLKIVPYENDFIVGADFAANNNLMGTIKTLRFYYSNTLTYGKTATKVLGTDFGSAIGDIFTVTQLVDTVLLTLNPIVALLSMTSWAIGDEDGNIYIAKNGNFKNGNTSIVFWSDKERKPS